MDSVLIASITILLALIPVGISLWKGKLDFFSPASIFAFGFSASYGMKASLLSLDSPIWITYADKTHDLSFLGAGFVIVCGALLAFYVGYYGAPLPSIAFPRLSLSRFDAKVIRNLSNLFVILGVLSVSMLMYLIRIDLTRLFNIEFWSETRTAAMLAWETNALLFQFPVWIGFFALVSIHSTSHLLKLQGERPSKRPSVWLPVVAPALVLAALGSRAMLLAFFLSLFLYRHYYVKRIGTVMQVTLLMVIVLLGAYFGIIQKIDQTIGKAALELPFPTNVFFRLSSSYEQFETFLATVKVAPPLQWGSTFFEDLFYTYIPRAIWPEKPRAFGFLRAQNVVFLHYWEGSRATTYPIGVVGELYLNFGYVGIFGGLLFLGALLRTIGRLAERESSLYPAIFVIMVATFLAPHRTFGTQLLALMLCLVFCGSALVLSVIVKAVRDSVAGGSRPA